MLLPVPALSATIANLDLQLTFEGERYYDLTICDGANCENEDATYTSLSASQDRWGLPRMFPNLALGDKIRLQALIRNNAGDTGQGDVPFCLFGTLDCSTSDAANLGDSRFFIDTRGFDLSFYGGIRPGDTISVLDLYANDLVSSPVVKPDFFASWFDQEAVFRVVGPYPGSAEHLAAVPLPATLPLLAFWAAGLASLRRRRSRA